MSKNFIPTINISPLIKNNFETQNAFKTIKEIEKACVNVGFFQITGHGINLKEIKKTCEVGNKFFNLPDSKKRKLSPKKWNKKNPDISSVAFSRLKTLSTLRFNYYPNQTKPVEISKQDGVALGCETHVDSGVCLLYTSDAADD